MKLYILFKTDFNHSYNSQEPLGYYTNQRKLRKDCLEIIKKDIQSDSGQKDKEEENDEIKYHFGFLMDKKQTQGLNNFELVIEEVDSLNVCDMKTINNECGIFEK